MRVRLFRCGGALLVLGVASCQAGPHVTVSGPAPAAGAGAAARVVLKLYSGSSTGLVVGEALGGGNPASQLPGQSFAENPGLAKTFIWAFAPGATMLDASCATISHTQAINIANAPVAYAAVFSGEGPALKVQILPARDAAAASTCRP